MNDIERLTAIEEIRRLMARYIRYADEQQWQELAGLFTPAGTFTPLKPDGSVWVDMRGREEIAKTLAGTAGPGDVYVHHLGSAEIEVESPDSASGIFNMDDKIFRAARAPGSDVGIAGEPAFRRMDGYGYYHGDFVKTGAAWYIAKLVQTRLRLDFTR